MPRIVQGLPALPSTTVVGAAVDGARWEKTVFRRGSVPVQLGSRERNQTSRDVCQCQAQRRRRPVGIVERPMFVVKGQEGFPVDGSRK